MAHRKGVICSFSELHYSFLKPHDNLEQTFYLLKPHNTLEPIFTQPHDNLEPHYDWVERVHSSCVKHNVQFIFGQTGNVSIKDGKEYKIRNRTEQMVQALRSGLHYPPKDIEKEVNDIYARKQAMLEIKTKK